jgi:ribosomal protein S18 acetylase RimI-like enzyme
MKHSMSESELLRLADLNLVEFWCESSKWVPNTEIVQRQDTVFINSATDFPGCNFAFNLAVEPDEKPDAFLTRIKGFFAKRKTLFSLILRGHCDQAIIQYCKDNKVFLLAEAPGMVLDEPIKGGAVSSGAELHWVDNEGELQGFKQVVAEAYQDLGYPKEVSESYFAQAQRVISPYLVLAVVYLKGEPACTALAILSHGIAGIYWVGTIKKARGIGLASYCTREVSNAAFALGARKVVLQASKFGEPVYLKMGYREVTRYPWFICSSE